MPEQNTFSSSTQTLPKNLLAQARDARCGATYTGPIVHTTGQYVIQAIAKDTGKPSYVRHAIELFDTQPQLASAGVGIAITYPTKRMALDLTFSAPKSISMQALVGGDQVIVEAHDRAVATALKEVEKYAIARKREGEKRFWQRTGNMVVALFRHEMSRAKDPQLHTHAVVLNMTLREDGKWRALTNDDLYRIQKQIDALYKSELAKELMSLGYEIRASDAEGGFELAHISRIQIEAFSQRGEMIERVLAEQGKTRETASALEKQIISLATRGKKDEKDKELIKKYWVEKSKAYGIDYGERAMPGSGMAAAHRALLLQSLPQNLTPSQAVVRYAINHFTEREAVVSHDQLISVALRRAVGVAGKNEIEAEIQRMVKQGALIERPLRYQAVAQNRKQEGRAYEKAAKTFIAWQHDLVKNQGWSKEQARAYLTQAIARGSLIPQEQEYTTDQALKQERAILAIERDGRQMVDAVLTKETAEAYFAGTILNAGQRAAAIDVVTSENRVVGILGDAGVGKTETLKAFKPVFEQAGYRLMALAPYGNQKKAINALNIDGLHAQTLASFLKAKNKVIDDKTVIVLDEAGVVPVRQMHALMKLLERHQARLIVIGDIKQTKAIEAGKPFDQLIDAGMQTAHINEILRQQNPDLKKSVELAAQGDAINVKQSPDYLSGIKEIADDASRRTVLVDDYMAMPENIREGTLIIAGTNEARRDINEKIRVANGLSGMGEHYQTLDRLDMTRAERRYAPNFKMGSAVQVERDYAKLGLKCGETYIVRDALPGNRLVVQRPDRTSVEIDPRKLTTLSVYALEKSELAPGDVIRINRNDAKLDLTNGDMMRVIEATKQCVRLQEISNNGQGRIVEFDAKRPLHLEHAYASTVHSAQGLTNDHVMIDFNTKSKTSNMNLCYVAISRPRHSTYLYTDDKKHLPGVITRRADKSTALSVQTERLQMRRQDIADKDGLSAQRKVFEKKVGKQKSYGGLGI